VVGPVFDLTPPAELNSLDLNHDPISS
jgi:hypothetical protein